MKYSLLLLVLLSATFFVACGDPEPETPKPVIVAPVYITPTPVAPVETISVKVETEDESVLTKEHDILISAVGQGVAPIKTSSPAQAYALAKRAATADAYRLIAEKVKGVRIDGQDLIKDMMVKRSTVRTSVKAMIKNANIVETTFKDGLCEVEMEVVLSYSEFSR